MATFKEIRKNSIHKERLLIVILFCLILLTISGFLIYVSDYYPARNATAKALLSDASVTVTKRSDHSYLFTPESGADRGLVFYPGGKVEYTAYAPLMHELAEQGWLCVLLKMPFHLAVFDADAGDDIPEEFPQIDSWYIGGHSLGGSMAASCVADNDDYVGLVLLASYSTADLSQSGLEVYSVYGSEDQVLNMENYEKYRKNLPTDIKELIIEGGCHAFFGDYGVQDGDGIPSITLDEQIRHTVDFLKY